MSDESIFAGVGIPEGHVAKVVDVTPGLSSESIFAVIDSKGDMTVKMNQWNFSHFSQVWS